jgi:hypothetical protein
MPVCSASRHPVRGLLCPLSLLLRFTLSLADLWPVQWFAGPLSGPPLPGYSYPSICVSRSPECTSLLRPGVLSALVGRLGPGVVPFGLPAFDLGPFVLEILLFLPRLLGSWSVSGSCFVYCSVRRYFVFRIPQRHYPGSPCLHLARGLPRTLTLPVLPRFLFSFYSWIFMSALLLILLVLPRPVCVSRNACSTFPRLRTYSHCSLCLRVPLWTSAGPSLSGLLEQVVPAGSAHLQLLRFI